MGRRLPAPPPRAAVGEGREAWLEDSCANLAIPQDDAKRAPAVPSARGRTHEEWRFSARALDRVLGSRPLGAALWDGGDGQLPEHEDPSDVPGYRRVVVRGAVDLPDDPEAAGVAVLAATDARAVDTVAAVEAADAARAGSPGAPDAHFFDFVAASVAKPESHVVLRARAPSPGSATATASPADDFGEDIAAGASVIHVVHVLPDRAGDAVAVSAPRIDVHVESGAHLTLVEEVAPSTPISPIPEGEEEEEASAPPARVALPRTRVLLEAGASLRHVSIHVGPAPQCGTDAVLRATHVVQHARSRYAHLELRCASGGATGASAGTRGGPPPPLLSRSEIDVHQAGEETDTLLDSLALLATATAESSTNAKDDEKEGKGGKGPGIVHELRTKVRLDHPASRIHQLAKAVASGVGAHAIFDGQMDINQRAQQADSAQLARGLLLTRGAAINARPNLRIQADDVQAAHGCTVADLDEEQVFYLASRGIDQAAARAVLVDSFVKEVTEMTDGMPKLAARVGDAIQDAFEACALT